MMKIGTKILISYLSLIIILSFITGGAFHYLSQQFLLNEAKQQLHKEGVMVSKLLKTENLNERTVLTKIRQRQKLHNVSKLLPDHLIIYSRDNQLLYTNLKKDMLNELIAHPDLYITDKVAITTRKGLIKGRVMVVTNKNNIDEINHIFKKSVFISLLLSTIIAIIIAFILERSLTSPLRKLTQFVHQFSLRRQQDQIHIQTKDEIRELADAFNALFQRLRGYDQDQKAFLQNISHEFKTPLMSIQGNTEGILDGVIEGNEVNESLTIISQETERLKHLVEQLSYLDKLEKVEEMYTFANEDIGIMIEETLLSVKSIANQNHIHIHVNPIQKGQYFVECDHEKITRAIINLLSNAIRHAESEVSILLQEQEGMMTLEIKDDGPGIEQNEIEKIFQRFYSHQKNGTGLGLAITKAIVEAHQGTITAMNHESKGAIFIVSLPKKR